MNHALAPLPPAAALAAADSLADMLVSYGVDARTRSALRACFRHADPVSLARRGEALLATLTEWDSDITADAQALQAFVDAFAALPEADFAVDWLERLIETWHRLRRAGCAGDLPLRAARALIAIGGRQLLTDRESLSALETEILASLAAAGMCVSAFLADEERRDAKAAVIDDIIAPARGHALGQRLAVALAAAGTSIVGVLALRLRLGASTLTLDVGQRDAVMAAAIERLRGVLRESDVMVRTDLHDCAVILPGLHTQGQVQLAARKVAQALELPFVVGGEVARPMFAMGVVWSPDHGRDARDLVRCADLAVAHAMRGERSVVMFDEQLQVEARQQALAEGEFLAALDNGQLRLYVQPQIDLRSRRCVGGELLLRWTDSQGMAVAPWKIPDIAQRLGAAPQLTRWLIFGACRTLAELARAGVDIGLSVNLMARDLTDTELPLLVEQALAFWRVSPARLNFELIESALLDDPGAGAAVMRRLIDLGASTSIDDFGIGYSSILYLRQLPLHELKIDRAFVDAVLGSHQDQEIVASVVRLAHGLGLHVVAEGVENEATADLLRDMGCDRGQGYWIARPMPVADLPAWFAAWQAGAEPLSEPR